MIGLDIAKNVFEVHGRNAASEVVLRRTVKRSNMEKVFGKLSPARIGCGRRTKSASSSFCPPRT